MECQNSVGEYELIEFLGRGSYSSVWEARHTTLGRHAAVKVLDRWTATDSQAERFLREAQISGTLRHPHIVKLLELGHASLDGKQLPFLVYDLIEGVTLNEWCQFTGLSFREIATLVAKVASAVHCAHEHGVVHRDLKPENVLVDLAGEPHVTDFGLARRLDDRLTEQNVALGTVAYMSPEQAQGQSNQVGPPADLFALGAILFELLTGQLPYTSQSIPGYLHEITHREPTFPPNSAIPRDLKTICLKCLAKKPHQRYPSAQSLEKDLLNFVAGKPIAARPVSLLERVRRWAWREPLAATFVGLLVVIAAVGPIVALQQARLRSDVARRARALLISNYDKDLLLAYQAYNQNQISEARSILDRSIPLPGEPDLRGFAWHLLNNRAEASFEVVAKSPLPIKQIALLREKNLLAVSDESSRLAIWDYRRRKRLRTLELLGDQHHAVEIVGDTILVGDSKNEKPVFCLYELSSGKRIRTVPIPGAANTVETIQFSPTAGLVVVGVRREGVFLFDRQFAQVAEWVDLEYHRQLRVSPDGKYLAVSIHDREKHYDAVALIDIGSKEILERREIAGKPSAIRWRPSGSALMVFDRAHRGQLLRAPDLYPLGETLIPNRYVTSIDFHQEDTAVVGGCEKGSLLVKSLNGNQFGPMTFEYYPHLADVSATQSLSNGKLMTAGKDGQVIVSHPDRIASQGAVVLMELGDQARLAYAPQTNHLLFADQSGALRNQEGEVVRQLPAAITALEFSPDGRTIACGLMGGEIILLSATDFSTTAKLQAKATEPDDSVNNIAFFDNGEKIVAGYLDRGVRFWSPSGDLLAEHILKYRHVQVAVNPNRGLAFASGAAEAIHVFDLATGELQDELPTDGPLPLHAHPTLPLLISGHSDSSIRLWDLEMRQLATVLRGHAAQIQSLALGRSGKILATGDWHGTIRLWNVPRREKIGIAYRAAPHYTVLQMAFLHDQIALVAILHKADEHSLIVRIGLPRQ